VHVGDLQGLVHPQGRVDQVADGAAGLEHWTVARVLGEPGPLGHSRRREADGRTVAIRQDQNFCHRRAR
jgi:hypothetical protein